MSMSVQVCVSLIALVAHVPESDKCICKRAKNEGGWCSPCHVGYVASFRIPSKSLYEALETHGHTATVSSVKCKSCREASKHNGFCERCKMGWVGNHLFLSRLAHHLAKGEHVETGSLACPTCLANSSRHGWCEGCSRGMLGNISVRPQSEFQKASLALDRALTAIKMLDQCEGCAIAMVIDGRCATCKLFYQDGRPSRRPPAPARQDQQPEAKD